MSKVEVKNGQISVIGFIAVEVEASKFWDKRHMATEPMFCESYIVSGNNPRTGTVLDLYGGFLVVMFYFVCFCLVFQPGFAAFVASVAFVGVWLLWL